MFADPIEDLREAKLLFLHGSHNELVSLLSGDVQVKAVAPEKDVGSGKGDALVSIDEAVIIGQGLHQCGSFFFDGIVVANLRTKNRGLHCVRVANAVMAAEHLDQQIVHSMNFCDR